MAAFLPDSRRAALHGIRARPASDLSLRDLPSSCPLCGQPLRYIARNVANEQVYSCVRDGWFIFSRGRGLRAFARDART